MNRLVRWCSNPANEWKIWWLLILIVVVYALSEL